VEARLLLSRLFRDAGFRVVHDVRVNFDGAAVTADGWDPERGVGFEYIATEEQGTDVTEIERAAVRASDSHRLLILDSMGAEPIEQRARAFLESELVRLADAGT